VIGQLLDRLGSRHRVALLSLQQADEPSPDARLRAALELAVEVRRADGGRSLQARALRSVRSRARLLFGIPLWVTEVESGEYRRRLRELLRDWQPHVVQLEYPVMCTYLDEILAAGCVAVTGVHDPATNAAIDIGRSSKRDRLLRRLDVRAWRRFERRALIHVDAAVAFTRRDADALAALAPGSTVVRIPFGTDFSERAEMPTVGGDNVLFVGNFVHPPNFDAADRLARTIFPLVLERVPRASLSIVGDRPPAELRERADERVEVTGRVPDLMPFIERAGVFAAPIRFGGGMRVKVVEALAAGKAVVASSLAVEGLDVTDGRQLMLAETDEEFAASIVRLLTDPELRARLAGEAWSWARENLRWEASVDAYDRLYEELLEQRARRTADQPSMLPTQPRMRAVFGEDSAFD
jgi:glycosyltransferase involved in cell wall biosynthesis